MQCREFRDISESYLSDELLVETNHQINHHLEHCAVCRADFIARRNLKRRVKTTVFTAPEFQISPAFSARMEARLRSDFLRSHSWVATIFRPRVMVPTGAVLFLFILLGFLILQPRISTDFVSDNTLNSTFLNLADFVAADHNDCALGKLDIWKQTAGTDYPTKADFASMVSEPLRAEYSPDVEMLSAHDCVFDGKEFTHVILRAKGHIVSVYLEDSVQPLRGLSSQAVDIATSQNHYLQVATFLLNNKSVSVVSNLPQSENTVIAQRLSASLS